MDDRAINIKAIPRPRNGNARNSLITKSKFEIANDKVANINEERIIARPALM